MGVQVRKLLFNSWKVLSSLLFIVMVTLMHCTKGNSSRDMLFRGKELLSQNNYSEAMNILNMHVSKFPDSAEGWFHLGSALLNHEIDFPECMTEDKIPCFYRLSQEALNKVTKYYNYAIEIENLYIDAHFELGRLLIFRGNEITEGINHIQKSAALRSCFVEAYYTLGVASQHWGSVEDAIGSFNMLLQCDERHIYGSIALAKCYASIEMFDEALAQYEIALMNLSHSNVDNKLMSHLNFSIGEVLLSLGQYSESETRFRLSLGSENDSKATYGLAKSLFHQYLLVSEHRQQILINEVKYYFNQAVTLNPSNFHSLLFLSRFSLDENDWNSGQIHAEAARDVRPDSDIANYLIAESVLPFNTTNALNYLKKAIELNETCLSCHVEMGCLEASLGNFLQAEVLLQDAITSDLLAIQIKSKLAWGSIAVHLNKLDIALGHLEDCITLLLPLRLPLPQSSGASRDTSHTIRQQQELFRSYLMGHHISKEKKHVLLSTIWNNIAVVYYRRDQFVDAIRALGESISLSPSVSVLHHNMAQVLVEAGQSAPAETYSAQATFLGGVRSHFYGNISILTPIVIDASVKRNPSSWMSYFVQSFNLYLQSSQTISTSGELDTLNLLPPYRSSSTTPNETTVKMCNSTNHSKKYNIDRNSATLLEAIDGDKSSDILITPGNDFSKSLVDVSVYNTPISSDTLQMEAGHSTDNCVNGMRSTMTPSQVISLSKSLQGRQLFDDALKCFDIAIERSEKLGSIHGYILSVEAQFEAALMLLEQNNILESDRYFKGAATTFYNNNFIGSHIPVEKLIHIVSYASISASRDGDTSDIMISNRWLKLALQSAPISFDLHYTLGLGYTRVGAHTSALEHLIVAESLATGPNGHSIASPNDRARVLTDLGHVYEKLDQPQKAADKYVNAIKYDSSYSPATFSLGRLLEKDGQPSTAAGFYRQLMLSGNHDNIDAFIRLGMALWTAGRISESLEIYASAVNLDTATTNFHIRERLVLGLRRKGHLIASLKHADTLRSMFEGDSGVNSHSVVSSSSYVCTDSMEEALMTAPICGDLGYQSLLELHTVLKSEANVFVKMETLFSDAENLMEIDLKRSIEIAERATGMCPVTTCSQSFIRLAYFYMDIPGGAELAVDALYKSLEYADTPSPQMIRVLLARTLSKLGRYSEAIDVYESVLNQVRLNPTESNLVHESQHYGLQLAKEARHISHVDLSRILSQTGHLKKALHHFQIWLQDEPRNATALYESAILHTSLGDTESAITSLTLIVSLTFETNEEIYLQSRAALLLGNLYASFKGTKDEEAILSYKQAIHFDGYCLEAMVQLGLMEASLEYLYRVVELSTENVLCGESVFCVPSFVTYEELAMFASLMTEEEEIVSIYKHMISISTDSDTKQKTLFKLGMLYFDLKRYEYALNIYESILSMEGLSHEFAAAVYNTHGVALIHMERYKQAVLSFKLSKDMNPVLSSMVNLALVHLHMQDVGKAGKYLYEANIFHRQESGHSCDEIYQLSQMQLSLSKILASKNRHDASIIIAKNSVEILNENISICENINVSTLGDAHTQLGLILSQTQGISDGISAIQLAIRLDPLNLHYKLALANSLLRANRFLEVVNLLIPQFNSQNTSWSESSRYHVSVHAQLIYNIGVATYHLRLRQKSLEIFEQSKSIDSTYKPVLDILELMLASDEWNVAVKPDWKVDLDFNTDFII